MTLSHAHRGRRPAVVAALVLALVSLFSPVAAGHPSAPRLDPHRPVWLWPTDSHRVAVPYRAPSTRYGPGHRGIDLAAGAGSVVSAPATGVVAFTGRVADRTVLVIDHGAGLVSTLEPVRSDLPVGAVVRGDGPVGIVSTGGHTPPGDVHLGARRDGEYINPLQLLGGIPRAVLLPCCS